MLPSCFPRSHPTSSHNLNKTVPQMSFCMAYKHRGRRACCISSTFLTIQSSQWQSTKSQSHVMSAMYVFNCPVHSQGPGSPRGLAAASGIKGQHNCIITKTISDHHPETLQNCRKRLLEHSWKTSLKYRYIAPHSQSKGAEKPSSNITISHQALLHPHGAKHRSGCAGGAGG